MADRLQEILDNQARHKDILRARAAQAIRREPFHADWGKYGRGVVWNKARECARRIRQSAQ